MSFYAANEYNRYIVYIDKNNFDVYSFFSEEDEGYSDFALARDLTCEQLSSGELRYFESESEYNKNEFLNSFCKEFCKFFPSFSPPVKDVYIQKAKVLLRNQLFTICLEENERTLAIELLQNYNLNAGTEYLCNNQNYKKHFTGMKKSLLDFVPEIEFHDDSYTYKIRKHIVTSKT